MDDRQPTTDARGNKFWRSDNKFHRTDGPAVEWISGTNVWWFYDKIHRTDGPAVEYGSGLKQWYLHGHKFTFGQWLDNNHELTEEEKVMLKLQYG
jgi:hypothetical protein